jgi:hypothetical protein
MNCTTNPTKLAVTITMGKVANKTTIEKHNAFDKYGRPPAVRALTGHSHLAERAYGCYQHS